VRENKLTPETVWELKSGMLKKNGLLTLHRGRERFSDLGGLDALKQFCTRALAPRKTNTARPKGLLLLSPPGCGKSQFCKALGNEIGMPTLILDIGALMGSLVGQTEHNIRQALRIADAMSPCVLYCNEIDKALSGVGGSGSTDSGVSARLFGTLLSWMNDRRSDVFVVCTANNASNLPPEFSRAERFDGVFFLDLPSSEGKSKIWPIHLQRYGFKVTGGDQLPDSRDWTGAEIQSCCRLASLLDVNLKQASRNVVPVAVTAAESVQRLRAWAAGRCLDASRPGIYTQGATEPPSPISRRVARAGSN
jgi:SpoVK/Ycf46/Vps4 family AAA+-type ATPase